MGCDIHISADRLVNGSRERVTGNFHEGPDPFDWRSYGMFAFLSGVRNYSAIQPISEPRGLPEDGGYEIYSGDHSASWLSVEELKAHDYDKVIEDRRHTVEIMPGCFSGGQTAEEGAGKKTTLRDFLGQAFFDDLKELENIGADRIVFWFDN